MVSPARGAVTLSHQHGLRLWAAIPLFFGIMLVVAACGTFVDFGGFVSAVRAHGLVPGTAPAWAFGDMPAVEPALGVAAVWVVGCGRRLTVPCLVAAGLFGAMAVYALLLVIRPRAKPVPCGCGLSPRPIEDWRMVAVRNGVACGALTVAGWRRRGVRSAAPGGGGGVLA